MDEITKKLLESLLSGGVPGSILVFILWKIAPTVALFRDKMVDSIRRLEESIRRLEEAVDRRNHADLLRLAANPLISDTLKDAARDIIRELDEAAKQRQKLTDASTPAPETKVTP